jgi:hypothetical protein
VGGGAETIRRIFRGYRDRLELSTPEQEARRLVDILQNHPRRFQGKIAS